MKKPTICLIGAGKTGEYLLERFSENWRIVVIEKDLTRANEISKKYGSNDCILFNADATSKINLERAGIRRAYQVVLLVSNDKVAKEIIHILHENFSIRNISTRIKSEELAQKLRSEGVFVVNPFESVANILVNQVNLGETIALNIGKGEGEIIQIELTNTSPLAYKPLSSLPEKPWIVGAIYRPQKRLKLNHQLPYYQRLEITKEDELIIPKGSTIPQTGDKLILIGNPKVLKATAHILKAGSPVFPIRHGDQILPLFLNKEKDLGAYREFRWLMTHMEPCEINFLYAHPENKKIVEKIPFSEKWAKVGINQKKTIQQPWYAINDFIRKFSDRKKIGMIIYLEPLNFLRRLLHRLFFIPSLIRTVVLINSPVWIIRSRKRIQGISVFVTSDEGTLQAMEMAIDTALQFKLPVRLIQINPPSIIRGDVHQHKANYMLDSLREMAALHGIEVKEKMFEGNPVYETLKNVEINQLLVLHYPKKNPNKFLIPNSARLLLKKFKGSVLFIAS